MPEPVFIYNNFGHSGIEDLFALIRRCAPFDRIISTVPTHYLADQIIAFYLYLHEADEDDLASITIRLTTDQEAEPELNLLKVLLKAFDLVDEGDASFSISLTQLESAYTEVTLPTSDKKEVKYNLRGFLRTRLKPAYRLLFDLVHRAFLSQTGTNKQVTKNSLIVLRNYERDSWVGAVPFNLTKNHVPGDLRQSDSPV